jgi:hypothetical protein
MSPDYHRVFILISYVSVWNQKDVSWPDPAILTMHWILIVWNKPDRLLAEMIVIKYIKHKQAEASLFLLPSPAFFKCILLLLHSEASILT